MAGGACPPREALAPSGQSDVCGVIVKAAARRRAAAVLNRSSALTRTGGSWRNLAVRVCAGQDAYEDDRRRPRDVGGQLTQKIPEQLEVRSALPRNATLKILKYQLRDELKG